MVKLIYNVNWVPWAERRGGTHGHPTGARLPISMPCPEPHLPRAPESGDIRFAGITTDEEALARLS
jgi:hypothetical protein